MRMPRLGLLVLALLLARGPAARGEPDAAPAGSALVNGDLVSWEGGEGGRPTGWTVSVGATNGQGPESEVVPGPEGGLRLAGTGATKQWRMVSQPLSLPAGTVLRLTCEARAIGVTQEPGQFANAYVGLGLWKAEDGSFAGVERERALRPTWTPLDLVVRVAPGRRAGPAVFLSMTGALEVRGVRCEAVPPAGAYDLLIAQVARSYSFLGLKEAALPGGSWAAHARALRERALAAPDEDAFVAVLSDLLAPLEDMHVRIHRTNGQFVYPFMPSIDNPNMNGKALKEALGELTPAGRAGFAASLEGDLGYLAVTSLDGLEPAHAQLRVLLRGLFGKRGLVIDLRANGGGDERRALALVGLLTDQARPYARRRYRNGPLPGDLGPAEEAVVKPAGDGPAYAGPIVVLLGPGCVSSGEGMAQMLDALPNVRTVGQPTRGASGNPAPVPLPGGVEVWFSRWVNEQMDGTALEGRGVQPDVRVPHVGAGDPTLKAGIAELLRLLAAKK